MFQAFLDSYHNEMKEILKMMNDKIDHLSESTKGILQCVSGSFRIYSKHSCQFTYEINF